LQTSHMNQFIGKHMTVFYEQEKSAAQAVFDTLNTKILSIAQDLHLCALDVRHTPMIYVFIYDDLKTMHEKYKILVKKTPDEWVVGTCEDNTILLVSPANPGDDHDFDSIVMVAIHEIVHIYNHLLNPDMSLWMDEGIATYLSNMNPREFGYQCETIPSMEALQTKDASVFADIEGYPLSYLYIEFLTKVFGWDAVVELARTNDFEKAFSQSERSIYEQWAAYIKNDGDLFLSREKSFEK